MTDPANRQGSPKKDQLPAHGGLIEPLNRQVPAEEAADFAKQAASLKRVPVSDADLSSLYRFGDGGLSPLTGPMNKAAFDRVLDEEVIDVAGQKLCLDDPHLVSRRQNPGQYAQGRRNRRPGQQQERDRRHARDQRHFRLRQGPLHSRASTARQRTDHPGGHMVTSDPRDMLLGGEVARFAATEASGIRAIRIVAA